MTSIVSPESGTNKGGHSTEVRAEIRPRLECLIVATACRVTQSIRKITGNRNGDYVKLFRFQQKVKQRFIKRNHTKESRTSESLDENGQAENSADEC
jgi:hypothetical protein